MMRTPAPQRGSIIIYAMLTMSAMLAIGLTLNALFLSKLKSASAARNSIVALYAADSGAELCLFEARANANETAPLELPAGATMQLSFNNAGVVTVIDDCSAFASATFQFRADGTYRGVRRSLEIAQ